MNEIPIQVIPGIPAHPGNVLKGNKKIIAVIIKGEEDTEETPVVLVNLYFEKAM